MPLPEGLPEPEFVLTLPDPVTVKGGGELRALRLREPTANEAWKAEGHIQNGRHPEADTLYMRSLVASVSGISEAHLDLVPMNSLIEAFQYLAAFVEAGLDEIVSTEPTWEIDLPEPIEFKGVPYATLTLRAPATGEVRKAQGHLRKGVGPQSMRSYQIWLVTHVSEAPYDVVKQVPVSLLNAAVSYITGFPKPGPRTGAT